MKNGLIGSEQTTITCAHIIDPVWKFWGRKVLSEYRKFNSGKSKNKDIEKFIKNNCPRIVEGMDRLELFLKEKIS